jgi:hypothetical protein
LTESLKDLMRNLEDISLAGLLAGVLNLAAFSTLVRTHGLLYGVAVHLAMSRS